MTKSSPLLLSTLLVALLSSELALAQQAALDAALRSCLAVTDNLARLTCYDDLARSQLPPETVRIPEPAQASAPVAAAVPPAPVEPTPPAPAPALVQPSAAAPAATAGTSVTDFGQPAARVESGTDGTEVLVDRVVEAQRVEPTKWLLTLQSGQIWRQSVGKSYVIRPGDTVRISPTSWGSDYRLSVEGRRGYIQVTRQE